LIVLATAAALLVVAAIVTMTGSQRADAAVNHGQVVPETVRRDVPVVLDGRVFAHAQVGNRIFVGGDFQQVELPDGSVVTQPYIFAYDINTGAFDTAFRPVLNKLVRDLQPTAAGDGLYAAGLFTNWDADFPLRLAKLDAQGNLDTNFVANASARVLSVAVRSDKVFLAGDFVNINGTSRIGFAAVDANTGAVDPGFVMDITTPTAAPSYARTVVLTSDGNSLFGLYYGRAVNNQVREAVVKIDVSGATAALTPWNIDWNGQQGNRECLNALRDLAISPDDSFIVIGGQGADNPPNCDSVLNYPVAGNGTVGYNWVARMYSSVFSLAVSDVAVYAGGHFCGAPKNPIPAGGISSTWTGAANGCDVNDPLSAVNPSVRDPNNAVFRKQMAALDPATGQALAWDPGSNNLVAVYDLTLIDRGLLAGHDRDRFNDVLTGRSGFFDFGGADDNIAPTVGVTSPADGAVLGNPTELAGTANDNQNVTGVTVRLKNITTDQFLQSNGTFATAQADLNDTFTVVGLGSATWSVPVANLPVGEYEIRVFATDESGNTSPGLVSTFEIPGATSCTVALDANDDPVVTWSGFTDGAVDNVFVRRDGKWAHTGASGSGSWTDTTAQPGDHTYLVRWRPGGTTVNVTCSPSPITVPTPGVGGDACTATLNAAGHVVLDWVEVAGASTYFVRDDDGWVATVNNSTNHTDTAPVEGDRSYYIRHYVGGRTDIPCAPTPITVGGGGGGGADCTVSLTANGDVNVSWTEVDGVSTYFVRDDLGWVATVANDTDTVDTSPTSGARSYVIRHWSGGNRIDRACTPDPLNVP
jgi:hypothetical protein